MPRARPALVPPPPPVPERVPPVGRSLESVTLVGPVVVPGWPHVSSARVADGWRITVVGDGVELERVMDGDAGPAGLVLWVPAAACRGGVCAG